MYVRSFFGVSAGASLCERKSPGDFPNPDRERRRALNLTPFVYFYVFSSASCIFCCKFTNRKTVEVYEINTVDTEYGAIEGSFTMYSQIPFSVRANSAFKTISSALPCRINVNRSPRGFLTARIDSPLSPIVRFATETHAVLPAESFLGNNAACFGDFSLAHKPPFCAHSSSITFKSCSRR